MQAAIILAAGQGKRMNSAIPKVLHKICGKEMVLHALDAVSFCDKRIVVVGHGADEVCQALDGLCDFALQEQQLGTGHAVMQAMPQVKGCDTVLVLAGDMPLLQQQTLKELCSLLDDDCPAALLTTAVDSGSEFGRILRNAGGDITRIVEYGDATAEQRAITEANTSVYAFKTPALISALDKLTATNAQKEYYLTDCIELLAEFGAVRSISRPFSECMGCNDRMQLAECAALMQSRINRQHMSNGVTLIDPAATYIDCDVEIGRDTVIYPGNLLTGNTSIGQNVTLYPNNRIVDSNVGDGAHIEASLLEESSVGKNTNIGPNAHLRKGTTTGAGCRIGNFVETKNVTIDDGAKLPHLSYCGDGFIGKRANISCGAIFSNYDGVKKHRTQVGDDAFVGCNSNLVAPVNVGAGAYIAAGSTITEDVPADALGIARERQIVKDGWAGRRREVYHK